LDLHLGASPSPETLALAATIRAHPGLAETTSSSGMSLRSTSSSAAPTVTSLAVGPRSTQLRRLATISIAAATLIALTKVREWHSIDVARVDVGRFERVGMAPYSASLGGQLANGIASELIRSGVVHRPPNAAGRSGWRSRSALDSSSHRGRGRAGTIVTGSWREQHDSVQITIRIAGLPTGPSWDMRVSGAVADSSRLLQTIQRRTAGAVAVFGHSFYRGLLPLTGGPPTIEAWQEFVGGLQLLATRRGRDAVQRFRVAVSLDSQFTWPLIHAALWTESRELSDTLVHDLRVVAPRLGKLETLLAEYVFASRAQQWEQCYRAIHQAAAL